MALDPQILADAGGWAAFVALVGVIGLGVIKGWWVPGFVYRRETGRADKATDLLETLTPLLSETVRLLKKRLEP